MREEPKDRTIRWDNECSSKDIISGSSELTKFMCSWSSFTEPSWIPVWRSMNPTSILLQVLKFFSLLPWCLSSNPVLKWRDPVCWNSQRTCRLCTVLNQAPYGQLSSSWVYTHRCRIVLYELLSFVLRSLSYHAGLLIPIACHLIEINIVFPYKSPDVCQCSSNHTT